MEEVDGIEEESDNKEEDSDNYKYERNTDDSKNQTLLIGRGHFGKEFIVRDGIQEEANSLRKEWE